MDRFFPLDWDEGLQDVGDETLSNKIALEARESDVKSSLASYKEIDIKLFQKVVLQSCHK